jgi:hypothetical protein
MGNDTLKQKQEIRSKLESELYVERYDTFKESVKMINMALQAFNVNYQYVYDDFCTDFTNECVNYIDEHPDVDMRDPGQMSIYTLPIIMSMVENVKNKYGLTQ